jgi:hypothetical protein
MVARKSASVEQIKAWLFPVLLTVFGAYIWQDIKEIKSDVKALMQQSSIDKTRIDNLERQVFFRGAVVPQTPTNPPTKPNNDMALVCCRMCIDGRNKKVFETEFV